MFWWFKSQEPASEVLAEERAFEELEAKFPEHKQNQHYLLLERSDTPSSWACVWGIYSSYRMAELARAKLSRERFEREWPAASGAFPPADAPPLEIHCAALDELAEATPALQVS